MQLQLWPSLAIWLRGSGSLVSENFPQTNGKGMELFVSWWAPLGEHHIPCLWCQPVMWFSGQREEPEEEAPARGSVRDSPQTDLKLVASKRIHQDSKMWPCTPFRPQTSSSAKQPQWPWDALWFQHVHSNSNYRPQDAPKEETRGACRNIGRNYSPLIFLPHFWLVKPFVPLGVALIWAEGHELEGCYFVLPFSSIFLFVRLVNEFRILVMLLFFDIVLNCGDMCRTFSRRFPSYCHVQFGCNMRRLKRTLMERRGFEVHCGHLVRCNTATSVTHRQIPRKMNRGRGRKDVWSHKKRERERAIQVVRSKRLEPYDAVAGVFFNFTSFHI